MQDNTKRGGRHKLLFALSFLSVTAAVTALMMYRSMDTDSYYMLPLGKSILESGVPRTYAPSYYPGMELVAQQWLYAALEYLASLVPNEIGLMAFNMLQVLVLYVLCYRYLKPAYGDPFWCWLGATACMVQLGDLGYRPSLRPENITLILLLGTTMAMDAYGRSKNKKWLAVPPLLLALEMQVHMTMWPMHFCVMAAYLVPLPEKFASKIPGRLLPARKCPDRYQAISLAAMVPILFLQPYGFEGILYIARSMQAFDVVDIVEQSPLMLMDNQSLSVAAIFALAAWLAVKKKIQPEELFLSAGLGLLGCMNHHAGMFLPIALLALARPLLRMLAEKEPSAAADIVPKNVTVMLGCMAAAALAAAIATCAAYAPGFRDWYGIGPAIEYIKANDNGGNILSETDTGSVLYYNGFAGRIQGDSRHEMMSENVNRSVDGLRYMCWFLDGTDTEGEPDISRYLDEYDIRYILLPEGRRAYTYLWGWLDGSDEWEKADHAASDEWSVWIRKGENDGDKHHDDVEPIFYELAGRVSQDS